MKTMKRPLLLTALLLLVALPKTNAAEFTQTELAYMPATLQLELFKRGDITPMDVLTAQKAQFDRTEDKVNGVTVAHWDNAMKMAERSVKRYADGTYRRLEGITVGIKDEHFDKGWVVTQGSLLHKNDPPKEHADPIVSKLKAAGAIPVLQTTAPEFYLNFVTATRAWGVSRNPWNLKYAVGGSSGGSGASLAAGYVTLATGSDMGGSIRIPSAFNGLYGIKPAFGYFHTDLPFSHFSGTGPMARTFGDVVMMYNVIAGPGPRSVNVAPSPHYPLTYKPITDVKIAYLGGMGITEPSKEVAEAMADAIKVLKAQGATVDTVDFDFEIEGSLTEVFSQIALAGSMGGMFAGYVDKTDQMTHYAKHFIEKAAAGGYGNKQLESGEALTNRMYTKLVDEVYSKGYDIVIVPTMPTSHVPADYDFTTDEPLSEEGIDFPKAVGMQYTLPFNILNWSPVISVPAGISSQGMQIVGKPHDTKMALRVGYAFSKGGPKLFTGDLLPENARAQ
jgi:amidase